MPEVRKPHSELREDFEIVRASLRRSQRPGDSGQPLEDYLAFADMDALTRIQEQKESLDEALREILDICEGWTRKLHDDEKLTFIKRAAESALSNPAFVPNDSLSPAPNSEQTPASSPFGKADHRAEPNDMSAT